MKRTVTYMRQGRRFIALLTALLGVSLLWEGAALADGASATFGVSVRIRRHSDHAFLRHQADGQLVASSARTSHLRIAPCEGEDCRIESASRQVVMRQDGTIQFLGQSDQQQAVQLLLQYE